LNLRFRRQATPLPLGHINYADIVRSAATYVFGFNVCMSVYVKENLNHVQSKRSVTALVISSVASINEGSER